MFKVDGREFTLRLDYAKARKIRETLQVDFVDFDSLPGTLVKFRQKRDLFMSVLVELLNGQLEAQSLNPEQFYSSFKDGDDFAVARKALEECAINFSDPEDRDWLTKAIDLSKKMLDELLSKTLEKTDATGG